MSAIVISIIAVIATTLLGIFCYYKGWFDGE